MHLKFFSVKKLNNSLQNLYLQPKLCFCMMISSFEKPFKDAEIRLLRGSVLLLFLGRAWQGVFWDLPLRTFFWDQQLMQTFVLWLTQDTWQQYVTNQSLNIDRLINSLGFSLGCFWAFCAVLTAYIRQGYRWLGFCLRLGALSLFLLALLYFKDKFYATGQLFEYAAQISAPLLLIHMLSGASNTPSFRLVIRGIIATTFVCHGLYAIAYYPVPGTWLQWCMRILGFESDEAALYFLWVMGCLDFLAAIGLFFNRTIRYSLIYCIVWGFATALARIVGNFYWDTAWLSLHQHAYETSYRLIHGSLPLLLWWLSSKSKA